MYEDREDLSGFEAPVGPGAPDEQAPGGCGKEESNFALVGLCHRATGLEELKGLPLRGATAVGATRQVAPPLPSLARRIPFPTGAEMETVLRPVRAAEAEMVRFDPTAAGHRRGGLGCLPGPRLPPCPNSCLNFSKPLLTVAPGFF